MTLHDETNKRIEELGLRLDRLEKKTETDLHTIGLGMRFVTNEILAELEKLGKVKEPRDYRGDNIVLGED